MQTADLFTAFVLINMIALLFFLHYKSPRGDFIYKTYIRKKNKFD